jgi:Mce-associated membrane protein
MTATAPAEPAEKEGRAAKAGRVLRQLSGSRSAVVVAALIIVVAGLATSTGILFVQVRSSQDTQAARTASVTAAKQQVPALLSYSYQSFRSSLARAEADTTGSFRGTYGNLMTSQVEPVAMQNHVVAQASVSGTSVIGAAPGTTTLLVFMSEQTKTDAQAEAVLNENAVRVTMRDVNGHWLVAGLVPRS